MGLLSKLIGGGWERTVEKARRLEEQGASGDALIEYERALAGDREDVAPERIREVEQRAVALRDLMSGEHIAEGDRFRDEGNLELAVEEYQTALQVAGSEPREREAQERLDGLEAALARLMTRQVREPTEEETFQALSGGWDEDQYDEYETYGDAFRTAFLAFHSGRPHEAVPVYEGLLEQAGEDAVFLLYELGRARSACATRVAEEGGAHDEAAAHNREAVDALERFLDRLPGSWAPALRAAAWNELAQIHLENHRPDDAEDALMNAQEAVPGEVLAYLNLGRFLMREKRFDEAVDALEQGVEVMDKLRPDFRILAELGLAYRAAGRVDEALSTLEAAVKAMVVEQQGYHDPYITVPLAQMLEQKGRTEQACDLYRHLAEGPDVANLAGYSTEAARLLLEQGELALARSYLARARELAGEDADLLRRLDALADRL